METHDLEEMLEIIPTEGSPVLELSRDRGK